MVVDFDRVRRDCDCDTRNRGPREPASRDLNLTLIYSVIPVGRRNDGNSLFRGSFFKSDSTNVRLLTPLQYSPSSRAKCQGECKGTPIPKGVLRYGSQWERGRRQYVKWRHWYLTPVVPLSFLLSTVFQGMRYASDSCSRW